MANVSKFCKIVNQYSEQVDFLVIYISEAHSKQGWYMKSNKYQLDDHQSLEDRIDAAKLFKDSTKLPDVCPILVDNMKDGANKAYGAQPERLYILQDGLVAYQGGFGPFNYNIDEMEKALSILIEKGRK